MFPEFYKFLSTGAAAVLRQQNSPWLRSHQSPGCPAGPQDLRTRPQSCSPRYGNWEVPLVPTPTQGFFGETRPPGRVERSRLPSPSIWGPASSQRHVATHVESRGHSVPTGPISLLRLVVSLQRQLPAHVGRAHAAAKLLCSSPPAAVRLRQLDQRPPPPNSWAGLAATTKFHNPKGFRKLGIRQGRQQWE